MSTIEELKGYDNQVLAEMVAQLQEEVKTLRGFRAEFNITTPAALYSGIRVGWAFLLCEPDCWLEISVSIEQKCVGQSQVWDEPESLKAAWGHLMSGHQRAIIDQYKTGIVVTHDNGLDVYPMVGTERGKPEIAN